MVIIILVCIGFGTSFHLTNAYGMTGIMSRFPIVLTCSCQRHGCNNDSSVNSDVRCLGFHFHHSTCFPRIFWAY